MKLSFLKKKRCVSENIQFTNQHRSRRSNEFNIFLLQMSLIAKYLLVLNIILL